MVNRLFIFFLFFIFSGNIIAQKNCQLDLNGILTYADSDEPVAFATVLVQELNRGTVTDSSGKFQIEDLCEGSYTLSCSHINCEHKDVTIELKEGFKAKIHLDSREYEMSEVEIRDIKVAPKSTQAVSVIDERALDQVRGKTLGESL
jgi:iron complex outermembrane receptor protein